VSDDVEHVEPPSMGAILASATTRKRQHQADLARALHAPREAEPVTVPDELLDSLADRVVDRLRTPPTTPPDPIEGAALRRYSDRSQLEARLRRELRA
jgi:hypothetical protein